MTSENFWNNDWMELQRKYWDMWQNTNNSTMGASANTSSFNPWANGLDQFWSNLKPAAAPDSSRFMEQMLDQGRSFFQFSQQFIDQGSGGGNAYNSINDALKQWQDKLSMGAASYHSGVDLQHQFRKPLEDWLSFSQQLMGKNNLLDGKAFPELEIPDFLQGPAALGFHREGQEQYEELLKRLLSYQDSMSEYTSFFSDLTPLAIERLRNELADGLGEGKPITSARDLYNLWVDICEKLYAERVMTPEYLKLHGRMVNDLMSYRQQWLLLSNKSLANLNIPTNDEINTILKRLQGLKRENRTLKKELNAIKKALSEQGNSGDLSAIGEALDSKAEKAELVAMQKVLAKLGEQVANLDKGTQQAAPAKKKAAPRRSTAKKTSSASTKKSS